MCIKFLNCERFTRYCWCGTEWRCSTSPFPGGNTFPHIVIHSVWFKEKPKQSNLVVCFITARVRSTREGNNLTRVCLSFHMGGGGKVPHLHPIILPTTGPMFFPGSTHLHPIILLLVPCPLFGGTQLQAGGYSGTGWYYPYTGLD